MSQGREGRSRGLQQRAKALSRREGISYQEALRRLRAADARAIAPAPGFPPGPEGLPLLTVRDSREPVIVDPFHRAHPNATTVVCGGSDAARASMARMMVGGSVALGAHAVVVDHAGTFEVPPNLLPTARVVGLGGEDGDAINPWDLGGLAEPPAHTVELLVILHEMLLGRSLRQLERALLHDAIISTYHTCQERRTPPRERELVDLMRDRATARDADLTARMTQHGERPTSTDVAAIECLEALVAELAGYVGDGEHAAVWDRLSTVTDSPSLLVFDYSAVAPDQRAAATYATMQWTERHVQQITDRLRSTRGDGVFDGRTLVLLAAGDDWSDAPGLVTQATFWARSARNLGAWFIVASRHADAFAGNALSILLNASLLFWFSQRESSLAFLRGEGRLDAGVLELLIGLDAAGAVPGGGEDCVAANGAFGHPVATVALGPDAYAQWLAALTGTGRPRA